VKLATTSSIAITLAIVVLALCTLTTTTSAREWYIKADGTGDQPTIQAAIDVAEPGDVILVAAGRYTWANQGGSDFAMIRIERGRERFVLRSESGPEATIIDAQRQSRGLFIDGLNYVEIDGFTITGGLAPAVGDHVGGGIALGHPADVIKNCIFENNEAITAGGLFVGGFGFATVENCVFRNNQAQVSGGGLWFGWSPDGFSVINCQVYNNTAATGAGISASNATLTIENTVIVNNTATVAGGGINASGVRPTIISGCTISANEAPDGSAIRLFGTMPVSIERSILSFNRTGSPLTLENGATPTIACCNIFGNLAGDTLPVGAIDSGDNIFLDPVFCNAPRDPDPTLDAGSPCLPGNHPGAATCRLIGARPAGCGGTVQIGERTWGGIKANYLIDKKSNEE
jgi:hypothetical protein